MTGQQRSEVAEVQPRLEGTTRLRGNLLIGALVLSVVLAFGYLLIVLTPFGHGFDNEAYLGRDLDGRTVVHVEGDFLNHITIAVVALGLLGLIVIGASRRAPLVGLIAAGGVGTAVAGAEILKRVLPWQHLVDTDYLLSPGLQRETYPSGHATIGTSFVLALLMLMPHGWRWWASVIGGLVAVSFGLGVVIAGWHRPSDAIGGACWSGVVMALATWLAIRLQGRRSSDGTNGAAARIQVRRSVMMSAGLGLAVYVGVIAVALLDHPSLPDADIAFIVYALVITVGALWVPSWYGNLLGPVEWHE